MSLSISIIAIPALTGFISAFFLSSETLLQFLVLMTIYKIVTVFKSIFDFNRHAIANTLNVVILSIIYFFYVGILINVINDSYYWTYLFVSQGNWLGLLLGLNDFIFGTIGFKGIVVVLLTIAFTSLISDRETRRENLKVIESQKEFSDD